MGMEAITTLTRKNMDLEVSRATNAHHNARGGAAGPSTTNLACFSAKSAAGLASVCPRVIMGTKLCALATTTGRPREEVPSALKHVLHLIKRDSFLYIYDIISLTPCSLLCPNQNTCLLALCNKAMFGYLLWTLAYISSQKNE
uniref:Uncharacterized protein n=1 Tax=Lotus japonicus TaxID=34305 RepID=I3SSA8_LOTJA|nr:unknown [Lotus japonicus]